MGRTKVSSRNHGLEAARLLVRACLSGALAIGMLSTGTNVSAQAQPPEFARAGELLRAGKPAEAYKLLAPLEDRLAGSQEYDYLLGVAALDSGHSDRATIAFERVLAVNPAFVGARLDMARAYFQLGDTARAKTEFDIVATQNPPPAARVTIATYLEAIERIEKAKLRSIRAYAEFTIGHDTNVNNSTSQTSINVPALGNLPFTLSPTNVQSKDDFGSFGAGIEYTRQIDPGFAAFAGADFRRRQNKDLDNFDNQNLDLRAGVAIGPAENLLKLSVSDGRFKLDNELSRKSSGAAAEWRYAINPALQLNAFTQYSRNRFTSIATQVNSFNGVTSGVGLLRILMDGKAVIFGTLLMGEERDTNGRADGPKSARGWRVGGQYQLREDLDLFAMLGSMNSRYDIENAAFLEKRRDEATDFITGINWRFAEHWTMKPQFLRSRNTSNIAIYPFNRTEVSLTLRRDFSF